MPAQKFEIVWEKEGKTLLRLPIVQDSKVKKSVKIQKPYSDDYGFKSHYVCPHCYETGRQEESNLRQYYICDICKNRYTPKDLPYRQIEYDGETVIYSKEAEKQFLKARVPKRMEIKEEIPLHELAVNRCFFERDFELYSEDAEYQEKLKMIYKYCLLKNVALLGVMGYDGEMRGFILSPSDDRLMITLLRDFELIKEPKMEYEMTTNTASKVKLEQYSKRERGQKLIEFIEMVRSGKVDMKVEREERIETAEISDLLLAELNRLEGKEKEKEVAKAIA
ncbi:MAG TPA: hypothetical protein ENG74_03670 [Thermoplasmatales archaeon]|nr:hypothetical protein [Thermoplasmatales archaeon]